MRVLAVVATVVALAAVPRAGARPDAWRVELERRLAALSPERPLDYLALAEDVMDRASSGPSADADRALARHLAALAGAIAPAGAGRSAALFLAEHSPDEPGRDRMRSFASALDPEADRRTASAEAADAVLSLVRAFALYRRGEGAAARSALGRPGAAELLDRHPEILRGGSARFRADCDAMRSSGAPAMGSAQVEALHALAAGAIAGAPRAWSEALARSGAAPLPETDVTNPRALFGVDPAACLWRAGAWTRAAAP